MRLEESRSPVTVRWDRNFSTPGLADDQIGPWDPGEGCMNASSGHLVLLQKLIS